MKIKETTVPVQNKNTEKQQIFWNFFRHRADRFKSEA
jgi:hypothetical protein